MTPGMPAREMVYDYIAAYGPKTVKEVTAELSHMGWCKGTLRDITYDLSAGGYIIPGIKYPQYGTRAVTGYVINPNQPLRRTDSNNRGNSIFKKLDDHASSIWTAELSEGDVAVLLAAVINQANNDLPGIRKRCKTTRETYDAISEALDRAESKSDIRTLTHQLSRAKTYLDRAENDLRECLEWAKSGIMEAQPMDKQTKKQLEETRKIQARRRELEQRIYGN